jgi:phosphoglycolate phosphatase-like HAD superfamily hydrolase
LKYRLAIFDMDGTLADSFPWLLSVVNSVADRHGFRRIEDHEIDRLRGKDSREILMHLRVPLWKLPAIARDMRRRKSESLDRIPLFQGVPRMLQRLIDGGIELAIVSSDSEANVRAALAADARISRILPAARRCSANRENSAALSSGPELRRPRRSPSAMRYGMRRPPLWPASASAP